MCGIGVDNKYVSDCVRAIQFAVGLEQFNTWFSGADFYFDNNVLNISLQKLSDINWVKTKYSAKILRALHDLVPSASLNFNLQRQKIHKTKHDSDGNAVETKQSLVQVSEVAFFPDASNRIVLSTINYLVDNQNTSVIHGKILHIFGEHSCGKTAILNYAVQKFGAENVAFFSALGFVNLYSMSVRNKAVDSFRSNILSKKCFVMDNVDMLSGQKGTLAEVARIIGLFCDANKIIITSGANSSPDLPADVQGKIRAFSSSLSVQLQKPGKDLMLCIAQNCIKKENLQCTPEQVVARVNDIPSLLSAIAKAKLASISKTRSLFEDFTSNKALLVDNLGANEQKIISAVANYFDVTEQALKKRGGGKSVSQARYTAIYILRKHTSLTMQQISGLFGLKSHANVTKASKIVKENSETNLDIFKAIYIIEQSLGL